MREKRYNWETLWQNRIEASRKQEAPSIDVREDVLHLLRSELMKNEDSWDSILVDFFTQKSAWIAAAGVAALVLFISIFAFKDLSNSVTVDEDVLYTFIDNGNWTDLL